LKEDITDSNITFRVNIYGDLIKGKRKEFSGRGR
jgi:hypothetical protein